MKERLVELLDSLPNGEVLKEKVADHLLANGVIVPPCKVWESVFFITYDLGDDGKETYYITEGKIKSFSFDESGLWFYTVHDDGLNFWHKKDSIGINVFFTKEEAEKSLAERRSR